MTGAGRSTAAKELEDLGFFVVDNLPPELVGDVVRLIDDKQGVDQPVAAVVDVRAGVFFESLREQLATEFPTRRTTLLFLEADDDILVRRQEAARRPHPLQGGGRLLEGIAREREVMASLRGDADLVIDTTPLNVNQLKAKVARAFGTPETVRLRITVVSFGFKYGVPVDADLIADMRFLPNPFWVPELRPAHGPGPRRGVVRQGPAGRPGVPRALRPGHRDGRRRLPARGQAVHDRGDRLHRRQAPQRGDVRGDRDPAARPRSGGRGDPPRPGPGVDPDALVDRTVGGGSRWRPRPGRVADGAARLTPDLTAVVTVADNGGSSGRLREEFGVLPPGDLRMALAALCGDDRWGQTWAEVLQHRFESDGEMDGHSMGNLLIVTLWELLHDHVDGLEWVAGLLGARGRVLPMATDAAGHHRRGARSRRPTLTGVTTVRGQVAVATTTGEVLSVEPGAGGRAAPAPRRSRRSRQADWVVLGPGSWYSSVIPHLLVPDLRDALCRTPGKVVVSMNLEPHTDETRGYDLADHLDVLLRHAPDLRVDTVLVDPAPSATAADWRTPRPTRRCPAGGGRRRLERPGVHDPQKLAAAYARLFAAN